MERVRPSTSLIFGRVAWKSKKSSGSMRAKRVAESDAPRNWSAAEAASPASFQPVKAQTRAGARRPSGRCSQISGGIRITVHHGCVTPVAIRDLDGLDGFLELLAGEIRDAPFKRLVDGVLADRALRAALRRSPCTRA